MAIHDGARNRTYSLGPLAGDGGRAGTGLDDREVVTAGTTQCLEQAPEEHAHRLRTSETLAEPGVPDVQDRRPEFLLNAAADEAESRVLPCEARSASAARRLVTAVLDRWMLSELTDTAVLVISELVTNAVEHAGTNTDGASIRVVVSRIDDYRIQVSVSDLDRRPLPALELGDPGQESGRGLALVDALSENWGVAPRRWGKRVWANLAA